MYMQILFVMHINWCKNKAKKKGFINFQEIISYLGSLNLNKF